MSHKLEADVRALKRRNEALQWQVKVLADRLALVHTECMNQEIELDLDGQSDDARWWEAMAMMLVTDDDGSRYRQAQIRGSDFYDQSKSAVRDWLRGILRDLKLVA